VHKGYISPNPVISLSDSRDNSSLISILLLLQTCKCIVTALTHSAVITDLQLSSDRTYFITSSKDKTARLIESNTLSPLKLYETDTPLNSAAIVPKYQDFVIIGGGQEARDAATTNQRYGKFECRFWHKILGEEVGRVKGHFGPINTIAVHPDGRR
jgi:translation initiation factor 3 subunit I